jgi:hypothetical protein
MRALWLVILGSALVAPSTSISMRGGERPARAVTMVHTSGLTAVTRADSTPQRPRFRLAPTPPGRPASGWVQIVPAQTPFGIAATRDGRLIYDLDITVKDLPPASSLGSYASYEAWLATPKLDVVRDLGPIQNGVTLRGQADWNKFTVIVSAEVLPVGHKWSAGVALIGRSPSSLMQSFASHPLFSVPEPD